jgi:hypothetical protein
MTLPPLFMQGPTTFHLASGRKAEALAFIQAYYNERVLPDISTEGDEDARNPFASLEEALIALGWEATGDAEGNLTFISFTDRSINQQAAEVLAAIAPCVKVGSSLLVVIERQGQHDFVVEGWFFDGTRLHREPAFISFPRSLFDALLRHS